MARLARCPEGRDGRERGATPRPVDRRARGPPPSRAPGKPPKAGPSSTTIAIGAGPAMSRSIATQLVRRRAEPAIVAYDGGGLEPGRLKARSDRHRHARIEPETGADHLSVILCPTFGSTEPLSSSAPGRPRSSPRRLSQARVSAGPGPTRTRRSPTHTRRGKARSRETDSPAERLRERVIEPRIRVASRRRARSRRVLLEGRGRHPNWYDDLVDVELGEPDPATRARVGPRGPREIVRSGRFARAVVAEVSGEASPVRSFRANWTALLQGRIGAYVTVETSRQHPRNAPTSDRPTDA
jgi:hypothetical protein